MKCIWLQLETKTFGLFGVGGPLNVLLRLFRKKILPTKRFKFVATLVVPSQAM